MLTDLGGNSCKLSMHQTMTLFLRTSSLQNISSSLFSYIHIVGIGKGKARKMHNFLHINKKIEDNYAFQSLKLKHTWVNHCMCDIVNC